MTQDAIEPRLGPRTLALTAAALLAFAANSLLCRLALGQDLIDAASFTAVRVLAGALMLALVLRARGGPNVRGIFDARKARWGGVLALFAYMACFSFAYRSLTAGTGALLLFPAVHLTMFGYAVSRGTRFPGVVWGGIVLAMFGVAYLLLPGVSAPDPGGAALMLAAGIAWGFYSLQGRGSGDPLAASAGNFVWTVPPALLLGILFWPDAPATWTGVGLAVTSGALASGLGYVVWYAALRELPATGAATAQLAVPVLAAAGAVPLLGEPITARLVVATLATLGGIALVLHPPAASHPMRPQV